MATFCCSRSRCRLRVEPTRIGPAVSCELRVLLYLAANYIVLLEWWYQNASGSLLGLPLAALYNLVFIIVLSGPLTAIASAVDRFILSRTASRLATVTTPVLLVLAPLPVVVWSRMFGSDDFWVLAAGQLIFGFTVSLLEFQSRSRHAASQRPNA